MGFDAWTANEFGVWGLFRKKIKMSSLNFYLVVWWSHMMSFHLVATIFHLVDSRRWCRQYKFAERDPLTYFQMLPIILRNQVFVFLPALCFLWYQDWVTLERAPTWKALALSVVYTSVGFSLVHDVVFYVGHRLMHTKWGFAWSGHALHHDTKGTVAASALYMGCLDFVVEILLPFSAWFLITRHAYLETLLFVVVVGAWGAMYEHSGFDFGLPGYDPRPHAYHHTHYKLGFSEGIGSLGIMDWMFQTSVNNRKDSV